MKSRNWKLPAIALFWMFGLGGCIGVPIALPEATPFKELVKSEFVVGETSTQDVDDKLGIPALWADDWRVYRQSRDGWRWFFCVGAAYTGGCGATDRTSKDFFLYTGFNEAGMLSNVEIFDSDELCIVHRLCFEGELLMRAAESGDDAYFAIDLDVGSHLIAIFPSGATFAGAAASKYDRMRRAGHTFSRLSQGPVRRAARSSGSGNRS